MMSGMAQFHVQVVRLTRTVRPAALLLAAVLALPVAWAQRSPPKAELVEGSVVRVTDGDSLWFQPADAQRRHLVVRLHNIDAPEICQEGGPQARDHLREWVLNRPATLRVIGMDDYGRTVGVLLQGSVNLNVRMVEEGHAWSTRDKHGRGPHLKEEKMARALRRGLHASGGEPVMPKDFRRANGPCPKDKD